MSYTEGPWHTWTAKDGTRTTISAKQGCIASVDGIGDREANAEFIVNACNSHASLVAALEGLLHDPMAERTVDAAKKALALATGQPERKGP